MKLKHLIVSSLSICGLLTACLSEPDFQPVTEEDGTRLEVQLFNEISQQPATRVNDEGFCNGDAVGVYVVNYVDGTSGTLKVENNQADNVKYTLDEATGAWTPETPVYYFDKNTKVDIYGYYPYAEPTEIEAYPFEIAKDQSKDAENGRLGGYEASDFLWAKADGGGEGISPTASKVVLTFNHIMAGVSVILFEGDGFESGEFATLEKSALVTNTRRQATINLSTGEVTAVGDMPTTGTIPYKKGEEFRAIIAPQTVAANTPLFSLTVDGIPYTFSKSEDVAYIPGKLHKFSIRIKKKTVGGVEFQLIGESITAWESESFTHDGSTREYVVINCNTAGGLKDAITDSGKDYKKVKNLKITGEVNANDFFFMRDEMSMLQAVNMKDIRIESCKVGYTEYYENEIPSKAFNNKSLLSKYVMPDYVKVIGDNAFSGTHLSGYLRLPDGLTKIGNSAFSQLNITSLELPNTLVEVGASAFSGCKYLIGSLRLPSTLLIIGSSAFSGCNNLSGELQLPESLEVLGSQAFSNCGFSGSIKIPPKVKKVEDYVFYACSKLDGQLILHDDILEIGNYSFSNSNWSSIGGFSGVLKLPSNLVTIGEDAFYACNFSNIDQLPETLTSVGRAAFLGCNFGEDLILPPNLNIIQEYAFCGLDIQKLVIPSTVEYIAPSAFSECYSLSTMICESTTPPTISNNTFSSVNKNNVTLEVPENSVNAYANATYWSEFKRISAHYDFSISKNRIRTLNAGECKSLILRAPSDAAWTVEECPEWITVTPSSGQGKTIVEIKIKEMSTTEAGTVTFEELNSSGNFENISFVGRRGEVVFSLNEKDYRSRTIIEQYNYVDNNEIIGDGSVIQNQKATIGAGVPLVFMGDCFDAKDISEGKYVESVNEAIEYFFDISPYKQYRDYFDIYTVIGVSEDSGNISPALGERVSKFGCGYSLKPDENTVLEYAGEINGLKLENATIVLIVNANLHYGTTYLWGNGTAISCVPISSRNYKGIIHHEAGGHGFGKLADESVCFPTFISTDKADEISVYKSFGFYNNISLDGDLNSVPWSHLIFDSKYSNIVDVYEGAYEFLRGVFRSETNSCMNNNVPYYSAISREAIVKRIMDYAGEEYSFEAFKEKDVMTTVSLDTKSSIADMELTFPARQQQGPVYMGEKPEFVK